MDLNSTTGTGTSSNPEAGGEGIVLACVDPARPDQPCPVCGGLGWIKLAVPVEDPRFGKMYRCPNYPQSADEERKQRLRRVSNLEAFADKTFENFEINPAYPAPERESLTQALRLAHGFAQAPQGWLVLEGTYGCGKTHLAAAVGNLRLQQGDAVLFMTSPDLLDHLRSAFSPGADETYDETFDRVRDAQVLILDDLGTENPSPWAQEKLFQLLNARYTQRRPTVITTNVRLDDLDPRISSRMRDTAIVRLVRIHAPDYRSFGSRLDSLTGNLSNYHEMRLDSFDTQTGLMPDEQKNLEDALKIARAYAQQPQGWLIFIGDANAPEPNKTRYLYGNGKTHLAAAIGHVRRELGEEVFFATLSDLSDYLRSTFDSNGREDFDERFQRIRQAPLLIVDDLNLRGASKWVTEKIFQVLDYRYVRRMPTVLTMAALEDVNERLALRLIDKRRCMTFALRAPAYATRSRRAR